MKKFLFTLAALMMAGSAFAADVVVANVDFTEDQIGKQQLLPLSIVLDNEYVNGWEMTITYPEGVTAGNPKKNTAVLNQMVPNADGEEEMVVPLGDCLATRIVQAYGTAGYWDPDDDGTFESYGAVKIGPTGTFKLYDLRVTPNEGFTGGEIVIEWQLNGGYDLRNGQTKVSVTGTTVVTLTAPATAPEVTEAPVITSVVNEEAETVTITATGNGTVILYNDDVEVARGEGVAEYVVPFTEDPEGEEMGFSATAQEEGKEVSEYALATIFIPGKQPVVPEVTDKPVITWTVDNEAETVTITATGNGTVILYNDDVEVARGEGVAEYVVPFTEDPEGEEMGFSATAQEEGKEVSEYALATVEIPGKQPVVPEVTEAPVINVEITDDAYIITATGEGEVVLYVNDEPVENPYTIARGEEDQTIYVYATAQEEGKEMGTSDVEPIVVEAKAGETPVDPHMTGYWIVTIDKNGNEVWKELLPDNGDYTGIVRFEYADYGTFPYDPNKTEEENNAMRPNVEYYVYVDGVRYGAAEDGTLTVLGEALNNPLFEGENNYVLGNASGRVYNMGVAIDNATNSMYVYAAVAYYTDVNEMNADKAVAGVRYFNMAGQEMQEANGMTIVVTTYTDGTTSAVKVMK